MDIGPDLFDTLFEEYFKLSKIRQKRHFYWFRHKEYFRKLEKKENHLLFIWYGNSGPKFKERMENLEEQ